MFDAICERAKAIAGQVTSRRLNPRLLAYKSPTIDVARGLPRTMWLHHALDLMELRGIGSDDTRDPASLRDVLARKRPKLIDLTGNSSRQVLEVMQRFDNLVGARQRMRDIDIREVSGLRSLLDAEIPFRTVDDFFLHTSCQGLQLLERPALEDCLAHAFGQGVTPEFRVPLWGAALNNGEARVYAMNAGDPRYLAIAQAKASREHSGHCLHGRVEYQYLRTSGLKDLLSNFRMVMVNRRHAERVGFYDSLDDADFPVVVLRGLSPFSIARPERNLVVRDILIFARNNRLASECAEHLLKANPGANFGAFLVELCSAQQRHLMKPQ